MFSGTVEDNIKWGDKNATHEEVISAAQAAQADEFIQKIPAGYEGIIAERVLHCQAVRSKDFLYQERYLKT